MKALRVVVSGGVTGLEKAADRVLRGILGSPRDPVYSQGKSKDRHPDAPFIARRGYGFQIGSMRGRLVSTVSNLVPHVLRSVLAKRAARDIYRLTGAFEESSKLPDTAEILGGLAPSTSPPTIRLEVPIADLGPGSDERSEPETVKVAAIAADPAPKQLEGLFRKRTARPANLLTLIDRTANLDARQIARDLQQLLSDVEKARVWEPSL
jgi:hypothetical protein